MLSLFTLPDSTPGVILNLSIILAAGFLATRATKKIHLPNVTGYILAGVLIGPYLLDLIPSSIIEDMDFITDIALALIAFGTGKYFRFSQLRRNGKGVFVITLWESLAAAVLVTLVMSLLFRLPLSFSLLLGAISSATAPASTLMTIRQYHAEGEFIQVLLQVVALDDAVALIAFSICAAIVQAMDGDGITPSIVLLPVLLQLVSLVLGALGGYLLSRWINAGRSDEHSLVLALAVILSITGFCAFQDISPLLACMVLGAVYINCGGNERLFHLIDRFSPPILLLFFVLSGMRLDVPALKVAGLIGIVYFFVRIIGKYLGAVAGCVLSHSSKPLTQYLGLALIPQAGVSIGLAALGQRLRQSNGEPPFRSSCSPPASCMKWPALPVQNWRWFCLAVFLHQNRILSKTMSSPRQFHQLTFAGKFFSFSLLFQQNICRRA